MKIIKRNNGNDIKIYATTLEDAAYNQIKELGEFEPHQDSKIRVMPDCHVGAGCTIGTTMEIKDKITPNLVGVDIGCGMLTVKLKETEIDLQLLDAMINNFIPCGFNVHTKNEKQCAIHDVSNSAVRPPLGLVPKWVRQKERYYEVCGAIARYYDAGKKIPIEWVEEYNELVEHCC